jgi:hypothetical protein
MDYEVYWRPFSGPMELLPALGGNNLFSAHYRYDAIAFISHIG